MPDGTLQEMMTLIPSVFQPQRAGSISAVIQCRLTGAEAGEWVMRIAGGQCTVEPGTIPNPNLTLTADTHDYQNIASGKLDGMTAFMQGKIKLSGDMSLAMKLVGLFKTP
jgi:putative sterol carrier protein